ncbi:MAG: acetate--CoA ligase family protein [Acidimicrobiales bacterium]
MATLSEAESKRLLAGFGVPFAEERLTATPEGAVAAAEAIGYPVVAKLCGPAITHKTERGLVRLGLGSAEQVRAAAAALLAAARSDDGDVGLLVARQIHGTRELIAGLVLDDAFGMTVMVGVGGVLAEGVADVTFRLAPINRADALEMIDDLATQPYLDAVRGEPAVDRDQLADVLVALSDAATANPGIVAADLNPLVISNGRAVAVDALVEVTHGPEPAPGPATPRSVDETRNFGALFEPDGVVVVGASTHPGKFGFAALHNVLAAGYQGRVFAVNRDGHSVLGLTTLADLSELPDGGADLAVLCTPPAANAELIKQAAAKGVRAVYVASGGYAEADEAGRRAQAELAAVAREAEVLLVGPNGQGVVSTPANLCAQFVAPYPPPGPIAVASQSGNISSSLMNYAGRFGVGISRAVSVGNAAAVDVADLVEYYADDPATRVAVAYVEGVADGRRLIERLGRVTPRLPVIVIKGGRSPAGGRAAASHTGALASDDRIFDGACRQAGVIRVDGVESAYEVASALATQPRPGGDRVAIVTTAGGWGVLASDAVAGTSGLRLAPMPDDLMAALDGRLPPRWSRRNPIDLAGGETTDTIPDVLGLVAGHPDVDAVVVLGLGIQGNQARLEADGPFFPDHGLGRIVAFHQRQETRYQEAVAAQVAATGKPILVATELVVCDPGNPAIAAATRTGLGVYSSAERAVRALGHLRWYAAWRERRVDRERREPAPR